MLSTGQLSRYQLFQVKDLPSRFTDDCNARLLDRTKKYEELGGNISFIEEHELTEVYSKIVESTSKFLGTATDSIILDVTSFPKRFFFPILRLMLNTAPSSVKNLIVTYTIPAKYTPDHLAENFGGWAQLPLFAGRYTHEQPEMLLVGVGFEALGLEERLETTESRRRIRFLLPFPAPVKSMQRSWNLLWRLQQHQQKGAPRAYRVDVKDVCDAFNRIVTLTNSGKKRADFAPFGPKPMSVAMCIYASITDSQAFYTQPTVYHPDYSVDIARRDGLPEIYGYCIRLNGQDLYSI